MAPAAPKSAVTESVPSEAPVTPAGPTPLEQVKQLMMQSQVVESEVQEVVAQKGHFPAHMPIDRYPEAFLTGWVIPHWQKIVEIIEADPDRLPF